MSGLVKLCGVVLRAVDYGESDRIVTLFTAERGKVAFFARGARASRRRFGGTLELFTVVAAEARERRGGDLLGLESVAVVRAFPAIRGDLARIGCAGYACDLARNLVHEGEQAPELLALLEAYLFRLEAAPAEPTGLRAYELKALEAAGLMPRLAECASCGRDPGVGVARVRFDPAEGGALCPACSGGRRATLELSRETLLALARLQREGLEEAARTPLAPSQAREAREALSAFIEYQLGAPLASRRFLDEVGKVL
ncbi:MAG TPA: DNA repair protein RecO [Anaeromyxobacteraceae bacterium]|nr:DNA repair protein RecO [Anaeromyxobacteraceae bacterium]